MSALIPVDINGVQYQAHGEFTSSRVSKEFQSSLAAFVNIFNIGLPGSLINGVDPNSSTLNSDILAKLDDTQYATQLLNALMGGTVVKNYQSNTGAGGPAEVPVTVLGLLNLAKDGLNVTDDPVLRSGQHFLSLEMAGALEQLVRSLQMAGVNIQDDGTGRLVVSGGITGEMIKNWKNLSVSSDAIRKIMQYAVDTSGNQNRTLQALVELIYVRTGNEILSNSLESLEEALGVTKNSLDALNRLQTLHNKITAEDKAKFEDVFFGYGSRGTNLRITIPPGASIITFTAANQTFVVDPTTFVRGVDGGEDGLAKAADEHFEGIDPVILGQLTSSDHVEFLSLRNSLIKEIQALSGQTGQSEDGTLLEKLRTVLEDIHKAFSAVGVSAGGLVSITAGSTVGRALTRWILDSTGVVNTALNISGVEPGQIQRNLTAAVAAGQSLNDTQKEEVRRYLFVFEEYYKSAAAILSKVTQILERMAQGIAR